MQPKPTRPQQDAPRPNRTRGFTIVELLVVIGIIAVLLSLISIGLSRGGETARQTEGLSNLAQISRAWDLYANQNDDRCLPGYLDDQSQTGLRIRAKDQSGNDVPQQFARTYPYRLLPFLDHDRSILYRYLSDYEDLANVPPAEIAANPAFGYNAFYLGGWWEFDATQNRARMRYSDTGYFRAPGELVPRQEVVARSRSQILRPADLITFCPSTASDVGFYKDPDEFARGSAWVVPHTRAEEQIWASSDGPNFNTMQASSDSDRGGGVLATLASLAGGVTRVQGSAGIQVFVAESVPLRRIRNVVQCAQVDGSTRLLSPRELMNQGRFINVGHLAVDPIAFTHP